MHGPKNPTNQHSFRLLTDNKDLLNGHETSSCQRLTLSRSVRNFSPNVGTRDKTHWSHLTKNSKYSSPKPSWTAWMCNFRSSGTFRRSQLHLLTKFAIRSRFHI